MGTTARIIRRHLCRVGVSSILLAGAAAMARADAATTVAGSLLCTTRDTTANATRLACNFNGVAGGDGGLAGRITTEKEATLASEHHVLMWSVIAPHIDTSWNALVGTYRQTAAGQLKGGRDGHIVLRSSLNTGRKHAAPMRVRELQLKPATAKQAYAS